MFSNKVLNVLKFPFCSNVFFYNSKTICTSVVKNRDVIDRKEMMRSLPIADEGTVGEKTADIDSLFRKYFSPILIE